MSTADVLGCLPVNRRTIYRLIKSGNLPAIRIGGHWRFRRSDLDAWIDRQRTSVRQQAVKPTAGMHAGGSSERVSADVHRRRQVPELGVV